MIFFNLEIFIAGCYYCRIEEIEDARDVAEIVVAITENTSDAESGKVPTTVVVVEVGSEVYKGHIAYYLINYRENKL